MHRDWKDENHWLNRAATQKMKQAKNKSKRNHFNLQQGCVAVVVHMHLAFCCRFFCFYFSFKTNLCNKCKRLCALMFGQQDNEQLHFNNDEQQIENKMMLNGHNAKKRSRNKTKENRNYFWCGKILETHFTCIHRHLSKSASGWFHKNRLQQIATENERKESNNYRLRKPTAKLQLLIFALQSKSVTWNVCALFDPNTCMFVVACVEKTAQFSICK